MHGSLLQGKIAKSLVLFAVPVFFSLLLQTLYNTVDTVLVGYFLGESSLAAMGAVTALFDLIVGFCTGCGNGFGIVVGQDFGAGDRDRLKRSVAASIVLSAIVGLVLSVLSWFTLPTLLHWLQTPADIFSQSLVYIRLVTAGLLITIFYNLAAGMLRAVGDSMTPLVILAISSVLNVFLDVLFIMVFRWGVAGAALATLAAQLASTIVCLAWIRFKKQILVPEKADFRLQAELVKELLAQGLSMGLMGSVVALGSVILQSGINRLGTMIIAAHTAARRLFIILCMPITAISMAITTFAAQNCGAGQYGRAAAGIRAANWMGIGYTVVVTVAVFLFSRQLVQLVSGSVNEVVLNNGSLYLRLNVPFFFALAILVNLRSAMQGLGCKRVPVFSSVIELAGKAVFTWLLIPAFGYVAVCWSEPVIWCVMMVYLTCHMVLLPVWKEHGVSGRIL